MKAVVLNDVNDIKYKEVDRPNPKAGEALVRIKAAGICGSDIPRVYKTGAHNMPLIIGHEFAGLVEEVADEADKEWIGKRVGVFPLIPCKKCPQCLAGRYEMCSHYDYLGSRSNGGFAEYAAVPVWNLIELPENASYEEGAMLEPMAVAVHAMNRLDPLAPESVLVSGAGTIGILLIMFLMEKGIEDIYVSLNKDFQIATLMRLGIKKENICDIRKQSLTDFIKEKTDGQGVDVYYECVGSNESIANALKVVGPSGRICYVGNPHSDMTFDRDTYWQILRKQVMITGTWNSSYPDDWQYVLRRLNEKKIDPAGLITHRFSLGDMIKGMEIMRDKSEDYIKIMVSAEDA